MNNFPVRLPQLLAGKLAETLPGIRRGIEKEALRVDHQGKLAQTPHSTKLGSALCHPSITTDFSEALLEFITPPCDTIASALSHLQTTHDFVYRQIAEQNEMLWLASMPCILEGNDQIPIAKYGTSNIARMKHIYRLGLGHRYGRAMQTIAGIHYNFSLPDTFWKKLHALEQSDESLQDFKTRRYFDLIRNYRRYFWLLLYLFGAAPIVCKTFVQGKQHQLQDFHQNSLYLPYATSLRMGNLGYQSEAQASLYIDYNSLDAYLHSLLKGLTTPNPDYEKIGLCENGEYKQLNTNILQIENEFYSTIRPKRTGARGETPLKALFEKGVEYIEVRSVDINPFDPLGISLEQAAFTELFLVFCLLQESPPSNETEYQQIYWNQHQVVANGLNPEQQIYCHGQKVQLRDCANKLMRELAQVLPLFDATPEAAIYQQSLTRQMNKIQNSRLCPAALLLETLEQQQSSFYRFVFEHSRTQKSISLQKQYPAEHFAEQERLAQESLKQQAELEAEAQPPFEQFLAAYYAQYQQVATALNT